MVDRRVCVAPMMGCTDRHCRWLLRLISREALVYSEMVSTGALLHGDAAHYLEHGADAPAAFQLGGSEPQALADCARLVAAAGYAEVNLNCGCPSDRVQEGGIGACLMAEPERVADCFRAMAEAVAIPVTVKTRIGIDRQDSYAFFARFIHAVYGAGCRVFIVHARAAWLQGLTPKENREIPPLRYEYVARIQRELPDATFVLNGGIKDCSEALGLLKGQADAVPQVQGGYAAEAPGHAEAAQVQGGYAAEAPGRADAAQPEGGYAGVMLGRAIYAQPMLLGELGRAVFGAEPPSPFAVFAQYRDYVAEELAKGTPLARTAKHLFGLFAGIPGARAFRRRLSEKMHSHDAGLATLDEAFNKSLPP